MARHKVAAECFNRLFHYFLEYIDFSIGPFIGCYLIRGPTKELSTYIKIKIFDITTQIYAGKVRMAIGVVLLWS